MTLAESAPTQEPGFGRERARVRAELAEEVAVALAGSLNLRRTVLRLLDAVRPELGDWAAVVLLDSRTGALSLFGGDDPGFTATVSRRAVTGLDLERVLRTGQTEILHVAPETASADGLVGLVPHQALCEEAAALRPVDVLGLGLTARGMTLGALIVLRGQGRGYDEDEIVEAERLANRAALALDSARLYEERSRVASALQASLLPPELPEISGIQVAARYRPAIEQLDVGGDFYDIHGAGDDWLLTLGDVCGKGVDAAVLTGRARQSIRTAAHFERRPSELLSALNTVFYEDASDRFITVVCARLRPAPDGESAEVELAVGGHAAPILLRADGQVRQLEATGTVVGVLPEAEYRSATVRLERGDTLLMFTDGVEEARGEDGFYGLDRLLSLLPTYAGAGADALCAAVEQDVVEHLAGRPHDDIALLAVTCGGAVAWQA
jgi:sigma-B regulation protein RsbU (phosphoserine phosphatase)